MRRMAAAAETLAVAAVFAVAIACAVATASAQQSGPSKVDLDQLLSALEQRLSVGGPAGDHAHTPVVRELHNLKPFMDSWWWWGRPSHGKRSAANDHMSLRILKRGKGPIPYIADGSPIRIKERTRSLMASDPYESVRIMKKEDPLKNYYETLRVMKRGDSMQKTSNENNDMPSELYEMLEAAAASDDSDASAVEAADLE